MTEPPTSLSEVNAMRRAGEISADGYLAAVQDARDGRLWHRWAVRTLAFLGGLHLLAGVVFFFAYNWDVLSPFAKFAILQGAILTAFIGAMVARIDKPMGEGLLIAASVFTGVLFAVVGQVYQTGADAWELFVAWSALILPWALASKSSAHWMLWIVIVIAAASFYGEQVLVPLGKLDHQQLIAVIGIFVVALALLREVAIMKGAKWLDDRWFQVALVVFAVGMLFVPALGYVFDSDRFAPGFVAFVVACVSLMAFYLRVRPSVPAVSVVAGFIALMAMALGGRGIHEVIGFGSKAAGLITSLIVLVAWCVGVSGVLVKVLNAINKKIHRESADE
ncbi:MAG: DUF2157 domain-containing protein [Pseudomonadota bacterium]